MSLISGGLGYLKLIAYKIRFITKGKLIWTGIPRLHPAAHISMRKGATIELKNRSHFDRGTLLRVTKGAKFTLGENSGFNSYCVITCRDRIEIGNNVIIGPFVTFHDHDHDYREGGLYKDSGYKTAPIIIEDNVWIGGNVVILKGVRIGSGSVIAAGTVVTKDVPSNSVIMNNHNIKIKPIVKDR